MLKKVKHTLKILRCEQDFLTLLRSMNVMKLSPDKLLRIHLTFLITFIMDLFLFSKSLLVKVTLGHCPSSVLGWWISLVTQSTIFFTCLYLVLLTTFGFWSYDIGNLASWLWEYSKSWLLKMLRQCAFYWFWINFVMLGPPTPPLTLARFLLREIDFRKNAAWREWVISLCLWGDDQNLGKSFAWGILKITRFSFWLGNVFSSNLNITNLNIFPNQGGIFRFDRKLSNNYGDR